MVASWQPRSFASGPEPEVDGNTRMVCRYPGSSPSLIPLWKEHAFAQLDDAKVLYAVTEIEIDQDQWLAAHAHNPTFTSQRRMATRSPRRNDLGHL